ncbi:MAG TPA: hypothetical protein VMM56_00060 [Planctomycetaceae bacterium]|nr:hypothetical protein [Planctomycetaceae bacterium]
MIKGPRILVVVMLLVALSLCARYLIIARSNSAANEIGVEVQRVSPTGDIDAEIECDSLAHVEFSYELLNRSSKPISNLKLGLSCGCESIGTLPTQIDPGESASVRFRLRAPQVGKLSRQIPVMADGYSDAILVLNPVLYVRFVSPVLLGASQGLNLTFFKGDDSPRELQLETIERKKSKSWITGLNFSPPLELEIISARMEELPETDPNYSRRRYFFKLVNHSADIGENHVNVTLKTRDDSSEAVDPLPLNVTVFDSVAIIPNPIVFRTDSNSKQLSKRVQVIHRNKYARSSVLKFDPSLILVQPEENDNNAIQTFSVETVNDTLQPYESEVIFDVGNGESRSLLVRYLGRE